VDDLPEQAVAEKPYLRQRAVASAVSIPLGSRHSTGTWQNNVRPTDGRRAMSVKPQRLTVRYLSPAWRAQYGTTLRRDEVRLVQAFRRLTSASKRRRWFS
jgi:hypothetical protein